MSILHFDRVTKIYNVRGAGQIKALDDVSFTLESRQTIGLVGQSGSGKSVVMEMVFSYPGVGKMLLDATNAKDYALMQGVFLIITLSVLFANIAADVAYAFLDPRTRQTEA